MLATLMLLAAASGPVMPCAHRPAAPDVETARRIAETIIRNRNRSARSGPAYDLRVETNPEQPGKWLAYQVRRGAGASLRGGGGLQFRIDRCTGAVSDLSNAR